MGIVKEATGSMRQPNIHWKRLGRDLKKMREDCGTGLRETAREAGFGHAMWCRAEQGKALSAAHFMAICSWMGESPYTYFRMGI